MSKNLLSFIRDDTRKPQIDRTRHIHQQLAISPDSPSQFHIRNANIQNILFSRVEDPNLRRRLEVKRIISQGKSLNMENHQVNKSGNLTNIDDSMQSEPDRYKKKYRIYDTITSEFKEYTRDLDVSQRSVFEAKYRSTNSFHRRGNVLEHFCNYRSRVKNLVTTNMRQYAKTLDPSTDPIRYQNELSRKIIHSQILDKVRKFKI